MWPMLRLASASPISSAFTRGNSTRNVWPNLVQQGLGPVALAEVGQAGWA
jgi:hypothetical protein